MKQVISFIGWIAFCIACVVSPLVEMVAYIMPFKNAGTGWFATAIMMGIIAAVIWPAYLLANSEKVDVKATNTSVTLALIFVIAMPMFFVETDFSKYKGEEKPEYVVSESTYELNNEEQSVVDYMLDSRDELAVAKKEFGEAWQACRNNLPEVNFKKIQEFSKSNNLDLTEGMIKFDAERSPTCVAPALETRDNRIAAVKNGNPRTKEMTWSEFDTVRYEVMNFQEKVFKNH